MAAGAAEGSLFKNFGDKIKLLTGLLSYVLPENQAWRSVAIEAPRQSADPCPGWNYGPIPRPGQLRDAGCARAGLCLGGPPGAPAPLRKRDGACAVPLIPSPPCPAQPTWLPRPALALDHVVDGRGLRLAGVSP